jgi:hypothetical protein
MGQMMNTQLKVYVCTVHKDEPSNVGSVIVAENEDEARQLMEAALVIKYTTSLEAQPYTLLEVDVQNPHVMLLRVDNGTEYTDRIE